MRTQTAEAIEDIIQMHDNTCQAFGGNWADEFGDMTDDEVAESIYHEVLEYIEEESGHTKAERFDGKEAMIREIKRLMHNSEKFQYLNG